MKLIFETYAENVEVCSKKCALYDVCGFHEYHILGNLCLLRKRHSLLGSYVLKTGEKVVLEKEMSSLVFCSPHCSLCHSEEFENGHVEYNCSFMQDNDGEKKPRPSYGCPIFKKPAGKYVLEGELKEILSPTNYDI